jgi:ribosomal-protein-alanine N-acetyltransferase
MQIRPAQPPDSDALQCLMSLDDTVWSAAQIHALCASSDGEFALLVDSAGELAGFIALAGLLDAGEIRHLLVQPSQRGRGLGTQLLQAGLAALRQRGYVRCVLEVRESNAAALALYARAGFQRDGVRPGYYPTASGREAAVLMSLEWDT